LTDVQAQHLAFASVGYLKAIVQFLKDGGGSRGSYLVLTEGCVEVHPDIKDPDTGDCLKFPPENEELRKTVTRIQADENSQDLFVSQTVAVRPAPKDRKAFEPAWADYREGNIYK
jgi:hypothetical protein